MSNRFSPSRLIEARIEANMTQIALSEQSGLSRMTISKLEKGLISNPSTETIAKLSWALKKPISYLCTDTGLELKETSQALFRSYKSKSKNDNLKALVKLKHSELLIQYLYSFIEPRFNSFDTLFYEGDIHNLTDIDIEGFALNVREKLGCGDGAISQLSTLLENHGVICISVALPAKIDSLSVSFQQKVNVKETSVILYNSALNYYRQRFSIAHELGHIILHRYIEESDNDNESKELESQANRFASAFLMPENSFRNSVTTLTLNGALLMKQYWKTSIAAIVRRMNDLGMISEAKYTNMNIDISRKGWNKNEPLDSEASPETPYYMEKAFGFLLSNSMTTADAIRKYCGFNDNEITEYIGNEDSFFQTIPNTSFLKISKSY